MEFFACKSMVKSVASFVVCLCICTCGHAASLPHIAKMVLGSARRVATMAVVHVCYNCSEGFATCS